MSVFEQPLSSLFEVPLQTIEKYGRRFPKTTREKIYTGLFKVHFSTTSAFRELRSTCHFFRIALMFYKLLQCASSSGLESERFCKCSVFRSFLHFPFGKSQVLSLGILTRTLSGDERLDERHIEIACKRFIPAAKSVRFSFFTQIYQEEGCQAFYIELENEQFEPFSTEQISELKKGLPFAIKEAIEKIVNYVHLPVNDDEMLRNCALLAREVHNKKSIPQIMIQYRSQEESLLVFEVAMVRPISIGQFKKPFIVAETSDIKRVETVFISNVGTLSKRYVQQAIVSKISVRKDPFLRWDQSIDFHQARKAVAFALKGSLGIFRDLNGGLFERQRAQLSELHSLLSSVSGYNDRVCERIYYSITPSIIKNICSSKEIAGFIKLFLEARTLPYGRRTKSIVRLRNDSIDAYVLAKSSRMESKTVFARALQKGLKEYEFALASDVIEDHEYIGILLLSRDEGIRRSFEEWVDETVRRQESTENGTKKIRISLPHVDMQLDPRVTLNRPIGVIIKLLFDGLFRLDKLGKPVSAIAESVRILDGGCTYAFTLRSSLWSNGLPVTAMDFEYSWKKILDPSFQTCFSYLLSPIKNADEAKQGLVDASKVGVLSASDRELIVRLKHPVPNFLELCSHWMFSPMFHLIDKQNPGWAHLAGSGFVCNGPFMPAERSVKGDMRVVKNPLFWSKQEVRLDEIEICVIEDRNAAIQQFNRGYLDWIGDPLGDMSIDALQDCPGALQSYPVNAIFWFEFDCRYPPFSSKKVRKAFSYAIDRKKIASLPQCGQDKIATSIFPEALSLCSGGEELVYDSNKAKELFEEGLREQNLAKSSLFPIKLCIADLRSNEDISKQVVQMWEDSFGIVIILEKYQASGFWNTFAKKSAHIFGRRWCLWNRDPFYTFDVLKRPQSSVSLCNWYSNSYSKLVDLAKNERDERRKSHILQQIERCVLEEMPVIPILEYTYCYKKNKGLQNVYTSNTAGVDFSYAYLQKTKYEKIHIKDI